ncbi:MAG: hypothetical protein O3A00_18870, partial [Planctomycetota bacterium]|nr:hypothetical protein [Planctomycetota bacterium]
RPSPQFPRFSKGGQFAYVAGARDSVPVRTVESRAIWLIRRHFKERASRELGRQAYGFQIWRLGLVGETGD